jgi:hypothetical protein
MTPVLLGTNPGNATRHKTPPPPAPSSHSGGGKSISLMSGGERMWIDACPTRAIALYLAQHSGRRYETLFSDEADGPLDPERKRMFMQMKREVLRLGGYGREFFITQTPQLAGPTWSLTSTPCASIRAPKSNRAIAVPNESPFPGCVTVPTRVRLA